jgi:hypothetical protein
VMAMGHLLSGPARERRALALRTAGAAPVVTVTVQSTAPQPAAPQAAEPLATTRG